MYVTKSSKLKQTEALLLLVCGTVIHLDILSKIIIIGLYLFVCSLRLKGTGYRTCKRPLNQPDLMAARNKQHFTPRRETTIPH